MKNSLRHGVAALAALGLACGGGATLLPDGGRPRQVCTHDPAVLTVQVKDATGQPVEGATVTATHRSPGGATMTGTTNANGVTREIDDTIGSGTIRVTATRGGQTSSIAEVLAECGECICIIEPNSVTVTLNP